MVADLLVQAGGHFDIAGHYIGQAQQRLFDLVQPGAELCGVAHRVDLGLRRAGFQCDRQMGFIFVDRAVQHGHAQDHQLA